MPHSVLSLFLSLYLNSIWLKHKKGWSIVFGMMSIIAPLQAILKFRLKTGSEMPNVQYVRHVICMWVIS